MHTLEQSQTFQKNDDYLTAASATILKMLFYKFRSEVEKELQDMFTKQQHIL